jgi:hypothetical protein
MVIKLVFAVMLVLKHIGSGDIEEVVSCEVAGDMLRVNYGYDWFAEFPQDEYKCELWEYKEDVSE